jgi:hypothetical protein
MKHPGGGTGSRRSLAALVARAFVEHDVPDADAAEVSLAARYVDQSLAAMPDVTRAGVMVAAGAAYLALSLLGRSPYRMQSPATRSVSAIRLADLRVPILSEFCRLTRGLGLVGIFEQRTREGAMR